MDAEKFGSFIAKIRRENNMTQAELAKRLRVTDKAVSRWERGLGFPDIQTIEPLADALGLSVLEVMRSERIETPSVRTETAAAALSDTLSVAKAECGGERKAMTVLIVLCLVVVGVMAILQMLGIWNRAVHVYEPIIGLALLLQAVRNWRSNRVAAIVLLCTAIFLWGVAVFMIVLP